MRQESVKQVNNLSDGHVGYYVSEESEEAMLGRDNPVANPLIVLREEFDDWAILFDPDTGNAFGLNPTAVYVWKLLNGQNSKDDIVKKLRDAADGVPDDAPKHIGDFIQSLVNLGLVGYETERTQNLGCR